MYTGPHLIKDNLVFGYDTGYGVADNNTSTRFYPGAPTTNLNTDPYHSTRSAGDTITLAAWGGDTGQGSFEVNTSPPGGGMMFINNNTSSPAGSGGTYTDFPSTRYTLTNGVTYTRSWWAKADDVRSASGHICSCNRDSDNTYIVGSTVSLKTYWQRYTHTFTYTGPTSSDWQFRHIIYDASKVYIANVQLEVGSIVSPPLIGTRSDTESLIDLKRTTDIDVSNVSFDSTGQPTFDGTDDYIYPNNITNGSGLTSITAEFVVKASANNKNIIKSNSNAILLHYGGAGFYLNSTDSTASGYLGWNSKLTGGTGVYEHLVATWDGTTMKLYVNGDSTGTTRAYSAGSTGVLKDLNGVLIGGNFNSSQPYFNGDIPIAKIHNRALSAEEVKQNYNAYKNRFGI